jgi:hypothetical protein
LTPPAELSDADTATFVSCTYAYRKPAPATAPLLALNVTVNGTNATRRPGDSTHDDGFRAAGRPPFPRWAPGELVGDRGRVHDPAPDADTGEPDNFLPGLPALAVGGGDETLSARCPATAAPDGAYTSANPTRRAAPPAPSRPPPRRAKPTSNRGHRHHQPPTAPVI